MADKSKIEWTDSTWNIVTGCSVVSAGCRHCYAMKLAGTRLQHHQSRAGLTIDTKEGPVWNGQVRFNEEWLTQPLAWKRPRKIFVCAHGDLFHEGVPDEWIDSVFSVMIRSPQHVFQVLTKRPARMREFCAARGYLISNVWIGVSVEDQATADERIPLLLQTPAAVRWISAEPLLGRVDLCATFGMWWNQTMGGFESSSASGFNRNPNNLAETALDWVVVGGESGPKARPMRIDWVRSLRDQCAAADVPWLFKQWGEWAPATSGMWYDPIDGCCAFMARCAGRDTHDFGDGYGAVRVGKKLAGRLLDGVTHDGYPESPP